MELLIALVEGAVVQYELHVEDMWDDAIAWGAEQEPLWRDEFRLCQRALRQLRPNLFE